MGVLDYLFGNKGTSSAPAVDELDPPQVHRVSKALAKEDARTAEAVLEGFVAEATRTHQLNRVQEAMTARLRQQQRVCVVVNRRLPKSLLVRLAMVQAPGKVPELTPDLSAVNPGKGVYICANRAVAEDVAKRGQDALRQGVFKKVPLSVPHDLVARIEHKLQLAFMEWVAQHFSHRPQNALSGVDAPLETIKAPDSPYLLVIAASNSPHRADFEGMDNVYQSPFTGSQLWQCLRPWGRFPADQQQAELKWDEFLAAQSQQQAPPNWLAHLLEGHESSQTGVSHLALLPSTSSEAVREVMFQMQRMQAKEEMHHQE